MVKESNLLLWDPENDETYDRSIEVYADEATRLVGRINVVIIHDNVVITIEREDVEKFGPVSTVVV
jgi:hypothetical protein